MPSPTPTDLERLTAALHLYSLARRPVADDLVRADGLRFLHQHEITDAWEGLANRRSVRAFLGLTRTSQRPMGRNKYLAALREVLDGEEAARWTRRGPSEAKVNLFQVFAVEYDREHSEEWLALFQYLDVADDWDDIDGLCVEMGLDLLAPLPADFLYLAVPVVLDLEDDEERLCRGRCGRLLTADAFRIKREQGRRPRLCHECRECESARLYDFHHRNPNVAAKYARQMRENYEETHLALEAKGRASEAHPDTKRCDSCRNTYSTPVGQHFHPERARPDGLSRVCKPCTAKAADRRRNPTINQ